MLNVDDFDFDSLLVNGTAVTELSFVTAVTSVRIVGYGVDVCVVVVVGGLVGMDVGADGFDGRPYKCCMATTSSTANFVRTPS